MSLIDVFRQTEFTLYGPSPYVPGSSHIICPFISSISETKSIDIDIEDNLIESIFGNTSSRTPWHFVINQGLQTEIDTNDILPLQGGGSVAILNDYIIDKIIPAGFVPMYAGLSLYPDFFQYEYFLIVFRLTTEPPSEPPASHEKTGGIGDGQMWELWTPPPQDWINNPSSIRLMARDGTLYEASPPPFPPPRPFLGHVYILPNLLWLLSKQATGFASTWGPTWTYTDLPWGQPNTPLDLLFEAPAIHFFDTADEAGLRWITGDTPQERDDSRLLLHDEILSGFGPFYDGHIGPYDRAKVWISKSSLPDDDLSIVISDRWDKPPFTYPVLWDIKLKARFFSEASGPNFTTFVGEPIGKTPGAGLPGLLIGTSLLSSNNTISSLFNIQIPRIFPEEEDEGL